MLQGFGLKALILRRFGNAVGGLGAEIFDVVELLQGFGVMTRDDIRRRSTTFAFFCRGPGAASAPKS